MPNLKGNPVRSLTQPCLVAVALWLTEASAYETDHFGGVLSASREATGFFRVEEVSGRWYFITPDGHPYIALGANHVGSYLKTQAEPGGLFARHNDDPEAGAQALIESLTRLGLNAGDAYQPDPRFAEQLPWVKSFHYGEERQKQPANIFDPDAVEAMYEHVRAACAEVATNPWVLGVAGPDLPRWDSSYVAPYRLAEPGSLARSGYEKFLRDRHESIKSLNQAYAKQFASWEALARKPKLRFEIKTEEAEADEAAFLAHLAQAHFATVRKACKDGAPNHLYFGERTQLRVIPEQVLEVMGQHIDVFCTQSLIRLPKAPPEWQEFQRRHYDREFSLVRKPMIIIDWAAPFTLENNPVETDYGTLEPEAKAGEDSAAFVHDAFESPYLIGLFICQVIGTHGNDSFFNSAKRTYLKDDGTPWPTRSERLRKANQATLETLYRIEP